MVLLCCAVLGSSLSTSIRRQLSFISQNLATIFSQTQRQNCTPLGVQLPTVEEPSKNVARMLGEQEGGLCGNPGWAHTLCVFFINLCHSESALITMCTMSTRQSGVNATNDTALRVIIWEPSSASAPGRQPCVTLREASGGKGSMCSVKTGCQRGQPAIRSDVLSPGGLVRSCSRALGLAMTFNSCRFSI